MESSSLNVNSSPGFKPIMENLNCSPRFLGVNSDEDDSSPIISLKTASRAFKSSLDEILILHSRLCIWLTLIKKLYLCDNSSTFVLRTRANFFSISAIKNGDEISPLFKGISVMATGIAVLIVNSRLVRSLRKTSVKEDDGNA